MAAKAIPTATTNSTVCLPMASVLPMGEWRLRHVAFDSSQQTDNRLTLCGLPGPAANSALKDKTRPAPSCCAGRCVPPVGLFEFPKSRVVFERVSK